MNTATLVLQAQEDIGGTIQVESAALMSAGRDINLRTTTQSSTNQAGANSFAQTGIDRVAGLSISGPAGQLIANAGRDLNLTAAQVSNQGIGPTTQTTLSAGQNINTKAATIEAAQNSQSQTSYRQETKSGLMGGGGIGFTVGKRQSGLILICAISPPRPIATAR